MRIIFLLLFIPVVAFSQYVAGRVIFEVSVNYGQGKFTDLNNFVDDFAALPAYSIFFDGAPKDFDKGRGLGVGFGYGINHYFALLARYQSFSFKNYNRQSLLYVDSGLFIWDYQSNLNFKASGKTATLNLIAYLFNSPYLGLYVGAGGGALVDSRLTLKRYFLGYRRADNAANLIETVETYKQNKMTPVGQAFVGLDISLGILTSLIAEGGYRHAEAEALQDDSGAKLTGIYTGQPIKAEFSGYYAQGVLRFLF